MEYMSIEQKEIEVLKLRVAELEKDLELTSILKESAESTEALWRANITDITNKLRIANEKMSAATNHIRTIEADNARLRGLRKSREYRKMASQSWKQAEEIRDLTRRNSDLSASLSAMTQQYRDLFHSISTKQALKTRTRASPRRREKPVVRSARPDVLPVHLL